MISNDVDAWLQADIYGIYTWNVAQCIWLLHYTVWLLKA